MKYLIILIIALSLFNNNIEITVTDIDTNETLTGVLINVNDIKYYTDFDGKVIIPKSKLKDTVNFSYISYNNKKEKINNNTTIHLKSK